MRTQQPFIVSRRILFLALAAMGLCGWGRAETARQQDKMHLQAALDLSPLAEKLSELSDLMKASVLILQKQMEGLEGPSRSNGELLKDIGERLAKVEAILTKLEREVRRPSAYEYKILRTGNERQANELGAEGWDLVTSIREDWLVFRRPIFKGAAPSGGKESEAKEKAEDKSSK